MMRPAQAHNETKTIRSKDVSAQVSPLAYRIESAAAALGVGSAQVVDWISMGWISARKIGRVTVILRADLEAFIDGRERLERQQKRHAEAEAIRQRSPHGKIYVVQSGSCVKIGFTAGGLTRRLSELQTGSPVPLVVLATVEGKKFQERDLHRRFRPYRVSGEWFRFEGDVAEWVEERCRI